MKFKDGTEVTARDDTVITQLYQEIVACEDRGEEGESNDCGGLYFNGLLITSTSQSYGQNCFSCRTPGSAVGIVPNVFQYLAVCGYDKEKHIVLHSKK